MNITYSATYRIVWGHVASTVKAVTFTCKFCVKNLFVLLPDLLLVVFEQALTQVADLPQRERGLVLPWGAYDKANKKKKKSETRTVVWDQRPVGDADFISSKWMLSCISMAQNIKEFLCYWGTDVSAEARQQIHSSCHFKSGGLVFFVCVDTA